MLSLIAYLMLLANMRDGTVIALISFPALALFYLVGTYFLLRKNEVKNKVQPAWEIGLNVFAGLGFAYCLLSLLCYILNWIHAVDMAENCGIILVIISAVIFWKRRILRAGFNIGLLIRAAVLLIAICISALIHFPKTGIK